MSIEIRTSSDGQHWELSGLASRTATWYPVTDRRGNYQERIAPGAFRQSLSQNPRVRLLVEHDRSGPLLGRTGRNLRLSESSRGLEVTATLDRSDPDAQSAVSKVRNGLYDQMSFAFGILGGDRGQEWNEDYSRRTVLAADLNGGDVSIVEFGCNPSTEVAVRSDALSGRALAEAVGLEVRSYGGSGIAVAEMRSNANSREPALMSLDEIELELRALDFRAKRRRRWDPRPAQPGSNAAIAAAVATSRKTELALRLQLAKGKRR